MGRVGLPRSARADRRLATARPQDLSEDRAVRLIRQVGVFDAADLDSESAFWAAMFGGRVLPDGDWHNVVDGDSRWIMGIQRAPNHVPPAWPDGNPQQAPPARHGEVAW